MTIEGLCGEWEANEKALFVACGRLESPVQNNQYGKSVID